MKEKLWSALALMGGVLYLLSLFGSSRFDAFWLLGTGMIALPLARKNTVDYRANKTKRSLWRALLYGGMTLLAVAAFLVQI